MFSVTSNETTSYKVTSKLYIVQKATGDVTVRDSVMLDQYSEYVSSLCMLFLQSFISSHILSCVFYGNPERQVRKKADDPFLFVVVILILPHKAKV